VILSRRDATVSKPCACPLLKRRRRNGEASSSVVVKFLVLLQLGKTVSAKYGKLFQEGADWTGRRFRSFKFDDGQFFW
jgi:hypothetical protein